MVHGLLNICVTFGQPARLVLLLVVGEIQLFQLVVGTIQLVLQILDFLLERVALGVIVGQLLVTIFNFLLCNSN